MKALSERNLIVKVLLSKALRILIPSGKKKAKFAPKGTTTFKICEMKHWLLLIKNF